MAKVAPRTYYRICLLLPLVLPFLLAPLWGSKLEPLTALATFALFFGGIGYLPFAVFMYIWIGRIRTLGKTQALSFVAPLLFVPFLALSIVVVSLLQGVSLQPASEALALLGLFAFYGLLVGYMYVGLANGVALVLELGGWLSQENPG